MMSSNERGLGSVPQHRGMPVLLKQINKPTNFKLNSLSLFVSCLLRRKALCSYRVCSANSSGVTALAGNHLIFLEVVA